MVAVLYAREKRLDIYIIISLVGNGINIWKVIESGSSIKNAQNYIIVKPNTTILSNVNMRNELLRKLRRYFILPREIPHKSLSTAYVWIVEIVSV